MTKPNLPATETKKLLKKKIRDLNKLNYNMDEIARLLNVSKTTVFYTLKGRTNKKRLINNEKI